MIDYEQAKQIALQRDPQVNAALEYKAGYRFFEKCEEEMDGGVSDFVVSRARGRIVPWISFMVKYHPERRGKPRNF